MREILLEKQPCRFSKKEKLAFCEVMQDRYNAEIQEISRSINIVLGDIFSSDYIVSAHYDTPRKNVINAKMYFDNASFNNAKRLGFFFINMIAGISKNKCNHNDNSSGVICACEIFEKTCVGGILFDNEERGFFGSVAMQKKNKFLREKTFINIDSIGVGGDFVIIYNKGCEKFARELATHYDGQIDVVRAHHSRYLSDSDNIKNAVTITCFKRDKKGRRYIDDIHTKKDNCISLENIEKVKNMVCSFLTSRSI